LSHIASAISELEQRKNAIDQALSSLRALQAAGHSAASNAHGSSVTKRRLSAEGRANIIAAVKKRWTERRAAQNGAPAKKVAPAKKAKKRVLSDEARKKMSLAAKKRWAAQKKKQAA
jgi:hypothetical protein